MIHLQRLLWGIGPNSDVHVDQMISDRTVGSHN